MPAGRVDQSMYVGPFRSVERINVATLYKPGELGSQIQLPNGKGYQLVQVDSGATASTGAGHAPQAGDLAFWKSRASYLVTNDKAQAETPGNAAGVSAVAGVFNSITEGAAGTASITPGNFGVIQQRGTHVGILESGTTAAAGDYLSPDTGSALPRVIKTTPSGTSAPAPIVAVATGATGAVTANYTPARVGGVDIVDVP